MGREDNLLNVGSRQYGCAAKEIAEYIKLLDKINFIDNNSALAIGKMDEFESF